ncbi:radical SAM protein [Chlorobium phaeovibrioides]|uniref:Radical SAM protein n=2 Tax=Chlorobium phaeovibrioides TaxID=1094 RepID=A0A432AUH4_CHLPH|nr:radical SAM protein [Chlorobium phaeovibrioides]
MFCMCESEYDSSSKKLRPMHLTELLALGLKHGRNTIAESAYILADIDFTRPVTFHALLNERCNCLCRHCDHWRLDKYTDEMGIDEWKKTLLSIRDFTGSYAINFSGGEPLIKKGFIELLNFCSSNSIYAGMTTNGMLLERHAAELVAARPFNINISLDSHKADTHDYIRGREGLHEKICRGIARLKEEQNRQAISFPIIIKPTVMSLNYRHLPELVHFAEQLGVSAVNFQPLGRWTEETNNELWIEKEEWPNLENVMQRLIVMKREGAPIMNSEEILGLMTASFREEKASTENLPCRIGLHEYFIRPDGDVRLCFHFPSIGNVSGHSAKEIWRGAEAQKIRKATLQCDKLCLLTCLSQKSSGNKISQAITMLSGQKK